jgi:hypothetical protein
MILKRLSATVNFEGERVHKIDENGDAGLRMRLLKVEDESSSGKCCKTSPIDEPRHVFQVSEVSTQAMPASLLRAAAKLKVVAG